MSDAQNEDRVSVEDLHYAARATNAQFTALGHFLRPDSLSDVPKSVFATPQFRRGASYGREESRKWFSNAWNTEAVLRQQLDLDEDAKRFALQWAFSQAYYAGFCQVVGFFVCCGHTQRSHTAVIAQFGRLVREGKYPTQISFFADGGMHDITVSGVQKRSYQTPLYLELDEPESVENQIAQFLNSTREMALKEKKDDFKFKTLTGRPRKNLNREQWREVSEALGPTSLLSLLYRKRIKANYREIDTFLRSEISGERVLGSLVDIVNAIGCIHEAICAAAVGVEEWSELVSDAGDRYEFLHERNAALKAIV